MKKALMAAALVMVMAGISWAGDVPLAWDAPKTNKDGSPISYFTLGNYKVYIGLSPGQYEKTVNYKCTTTTCSVVVSGADNGLAEGTKYYFAATAINDIGNESDKSNEVAKIVPITACTAAPGALR